MGRIGCHIRQFPYVEPIAFVYAHWGFQIIPLINQYMYYRISEEVGFPYLNLTAEGGCSEETFGGNSTLKELEIEVQTRSANLITYYMVCYVVPCVLISPFMGSYTDKKGRKIALIACLLGAFVETTILLILIYFKLSVYLSLAGGILNGLSGYFSTMWMALMSYLSDTVEKDKLSLRMAVLQLFLYIAGTVSQLTSGLWIEYLGFKPPVWFLWASLLLTILYTVFLVKETIEPDRNEKTVFFSFESLKRNFKVLTKQRIGGRKNLVLIIFFMAINIFATVGTSAVSLLFLLRSPLCWIPTILGYWLAYRFFTLGIGSVAGISILKKCFSEINIARFGFLSKMAGFLLLAFSDKTWMVFLVPVVDILESTIRPVLSSISSRLVSSEEQGVLFAIIGIISAVGNLAGSALFNTIYPLSLRFFPGFVFVLAAIISFGQMIMTGCINIPAHILDRKEPSKEGNALEYEPLENSAEEPSQDTRTTVM